MRATGSQPRPQATPTKRTPGHAPDYLLLTAVIMLCVIGLIAVMSIAPAVAVALMIVSAPEFVRSIPPLPPFAVTELTAVFSVRAVPIPSAPVMTSELAVT